MSTTAEDLIEEVRTTQRLPRPELARAVRESAGVSQARIANVLGVDRASVARWELGQRRPRGRLAAAYSDLITQLRSEIGG